MSLQTRLASLISVIGRDIKDLKCPWVTALPTPSTDAFGRSLPIDGTEVVYVPDPSNAINNIGVAWHMKYKSSDEKWYCIGGQPIYIAPGTVANQTISTTSYSTFTGRPSFTAPFAGIYRVRFGHAGFANAQITMSLAPSVNGATPVDQSDAVTAGYGVANTDQYGVSRSINVTVAAAGHVIDLRAKVSGGNGFMRQSWMEVKPIRVG